MKQLHPTKLWAVEVPIDTVDFKEVDTDRNHYLVYKSNTPKEYVRVNFRFKILGIVTKHEISFDPEPYVYKTEFTSLFDNLKKFNYKNYLHPHYPALDKNESFITLLNANDLYFENPYQLQWDELCTWGHGSFAKDGKTEHQLYFEAEQKLIKGRLLILEEL